MGANVECVTREIEEGGALDLVDWHARVILPRERFAFPRLRRAGVTFLRDGPFRSSPPLLASSEVKDVDLL